MKSARLPSEVQSLSLPPEEGTTTGTSNYNACSQGEESGRLPPSWNSLTSWYVAFTVSWHTLLCITPSAPWGRESRQLSFLQVPSTGLTRYSALSRRTNRSESGRPSITVSEPYPGKPRLHVFSSKSETRWLRCAEKHCLSIIPEHLHTNCKSWSTILLRIL